MRCVPESLARQRRDVDNKTVDNIHPSVGAWVTMDAMTAESAPRPRPRALWADARFVIGAVLVCASIAGVWLVVATARQTVPAYAATRTISSGEVIDPAELRVVDVALGALDGTYATGQSLPEGAVATRTIHVGELVPTASIGAAEEIRTTRIVVRSSTEVPGAVDVGTRVEVWVSPLDADGVREQPRILVADAEVAALVRDESMMGGEAASVELVVPRADVAAVLSAQAGEALLSVVPAGGAG